MLLLSWYTFSELWLVANLLKYESWFGWKRVGEQSARSPQTISCYTEIIQRTPRKLGLLFYFLLVLILTSSNCFIFFHFRKCAAGLCWTTSAIWLHGTPDKWISPKQGHAWVFCCSLSQGIVFNNVKHHQHKERKKGINCSQASVLLCLSSSLFSLGVRLKHNYKSMYQKHNHPSTTQLRKHFDCAYTVVTSYCWSTEKECKKSFLQAQHNTYSLSITRHSTSYSSAITFADLTSSLRIDRNEKNSEACQNP